VAILPSLNEGDDKAQFKCYLINLIESFRMLTRLFRVFVGSCACGAG